MSPTTLSELIIAPVYIARRIKYIPDDKIVKIHFLLITENRGDTDSSVSELFKEDKALFCTLQIIKEAIHDPKNPDPTIAAVTPLIV
jgi:hypothetical protein